jgi:hypothetical protein
MKALDLNISKISDESVRDSLRRVEDFLNNLPISQGFFQACEIFVTGDVDGAKIAHKLGGVPLDVVISRLIAPSAAKLTLRQSDFTKDEVVYDVTGLGDGETLNARFLVGNFPDRVLVGAEARGSSETQEVKGKF